MSPRWMIRTFSRSWGGLWGGSRWGSVLFGNLSIFELMALACNLLTKPPQSQTCHLIEIPKASWQGLQDTLWSSRDPTLQGCSCRGMSLFRAREFRNDSQMNINLRKAAILSQDLIRFSRQPVESFKSYATYAAQPDFKALQATLAEDISDRLLANQFGYRLRDQIRMANTTTEISALMGKVAELNSLEAVVEATHFSIAAVLLRTSSGVALADLPGYLAEQATREVKERDKAVNVHFAPADLAEKGKALKKEIRSKRTDANDRIAALNVTTLIDLDEDLKAFLRKLDFL